MIEASIDTIEIRADIGKGYPVKGDKGDNGYVHIAYANSADGKDFTLAPEDGKTYEYLGQYTDNTETASAEWSDYKWSWLTDEASRQVAETARTAAETARTTAEESRAGAEKTRTTAESERKEAESARANAESARASAEETRVANEDGRTDDEARRRDAENRRASTEQAREANETARVAAETKRETDSAAAVDAANAAATNAQSIADTVQAKLDAGEFKGDKGDSGVSPTATVTQTDTGATVTVTDAAGTTTANLTNGSDAEVTKDNIIAALGYAPEKDFGDYELIETIEITEENTKVINRGTMPDGTQMNLRKLYIQAGDGSATIGLGSSAFYLSVNAGTPATSLNAYTDSTMKVAEFWAEVSENLLTTQAFGRIANYASNGTNMTIQKKSVYNSSTYKTIRQWYIECYSSIAVGTKILVYGIKA